MNRAERIANAHAITSARAGPDTHADAIADAHEDDHAHASPMATPAFTACPSVRLDGRPFFVKETPSVMEPILDPRTRQLRQQGSHPFDVPLLRGNAVRDTCLVA